MVDPLSKRDETVRTAATLPPEAQSPEQKLQTMLSALWAVSYTHLDVYKRQSSGSKLARAARPCVWSTMAQSAVVLKWQANPFFFCAFHVYFEASPR